MSGTDSNSGFSFDTSVVNPHGPRTIKGVIWWCPKSFCWNVWIQRPKKKSAANYSADKPMVNKSLIGDEFHEEKHRLFIEAATAWNELDGSKRPRITLPNVAPSP